MTSAVESVAPRRWVAREWLQCTGACFVVTLCVHAVTLLTGRVGNRSDIEAHVRWAHQFTAALAEGQAVPRWLGLANGGLGEPTFVVLHPGYYYVLAALQSAGADLWGAIQIAAVAATFLVGVATCWVLRPFTAPRQAWLGAALMQTLPFMVFLFALYEALPWHFAFPLAVLATGLSLPSARNARWFDARLAVVIALLTLTHLMAAFMALLCLGFVQAVLWVERRGWRGGWRDPAVGWGLGVGLGLGMSAYYWLLAGTSGPLFRNWMDVEGTFRTSFVLPFVTSLVYGMRWPAIQWVLPLPSLAILLTAMWLLGRNSAAYAPSTRTAGRQLAFVALVGFLMSSEVAYPLYANIHALQAVQFPFRFLMLSSMAGALAFALALQPSLARSSRLQRGMALSATALSVALSGMFLLKQYREGERPDVASLLKGNIGTFYSEPATLGPQWKSYVAEGGFAGFCTRTNLRCTEGLSKAHHHTWQVEASERATVLLPLFAFPAWTVRVDGTEVASGIDSDTGVIRLKLEQGVHEIDVHWGGLWQERIGGAISWASVGVLALALLLQRRRKPHFAASSTA